MGNRATNGYDNGMNAPPTDWPRPPDVPILVPRGVHVWRLPLDLPENQLQELTSLLSEDEHERAARFLFDKHRNRFIACRGQVRQILARYLAAKPEELEFHYGLQGKPTLGAPWNESRLAFNVSHSHELALFAVGVDRELGVDLERVRPPSDFDGLAAQFFAEREITALRSLPEGVRLESFFRCWTRKEAVLKAVGSGLTFPLDRIVVTLGPGEPPRVLACDSGDPGAWALVNLELGQGYVGALATRGGPIEVQCWSA